MSTNPLLCLLGCLLLGRVAAAQSVGTAYALIPYPASLAPAPGSFPITKATNLALPGAAKVFAQEAEQLQALLANGLGQPLKQAKQATYFDGYFPAAARMQQATAKGSTVVAAVAVPKQAEADKFRVQFRGYLDVPEAGIYTFYLTCDDGGSLRIADRLVVDSGGLHSAIEKSSQVALTKGLQPLAPTLWRAVVATPCSSNQIQPGWRRGPARASQLA